MGVPNVMHRTPYMGTSVGTGGMRATMRSLNLCGAASVQRGQVGGPEHMGPCDLHCR